MENLVSTGRIIGKDIIRYSILIYWALFSLLNIVDKLIGGAHLLFVGKDRFAQIERFFDSVGLANPLIADIALIITTGLEVFALVFFTGALYHFKNKHIDSTRSWFFAGISLTLLLFSFFSIGDQIFGDHSELLEHGIYWLMTILSWFIFINIDRIQTFDSFSLGKNQFLAATILTIFLFSVTAFSIFRHNNTSFIERTQAVDAVKIDANKYKISFPFLAGSKAFENTIAKFKKVNPALNINYIYTAPTPLRLGEADGLIIYIQTSNKK